MSRIDLTTGQKVDTTSSYGAKEPYEKTDATALSEELLDAYTGPRTSWAEKAREDDEFRNNKQWTRKQLAELRKMKLPEIVVNVIRPAVEQAIALLTSNHPRFSASAREDSDARIAKVIADLFGYVWDQSAGNAQLKMTIDDYFVKGIGWLLGYVDPQKDFGRGEVCIQSVDPHDVYPDPNSKDIFCRDAAHLLIAKIMTSEQIQTIYPGILPLLEHAAESDAGDLATTSSLATDVGQQESSDDYHEKYRVIDRYTKIKVPFYHIYDKNSGEEKIFFRDDLETYLKSPAIIQQTAEGSRNITRDNQVSEILQIVEMVGQTTWHYEMNPATGLPIPVGGPATAGEEAGVVPNSDTTIQIVTKQALVEQGSIEINETIQDRIQRVLSVGGVEIHNSVLPISEYPLVPIMNRFGRNPYPMSDVRFVRPMQEYVNRMRALIMLHTANSASVKVLVPEGTTNIQEMRSEFQRPGLSVHTYPAELGQPTIVAPPPLPAELYRAEEVARRDIQEVFGIYPVQQGDPVGAPQTYKGTVALEEYAQRRIRSKLDDIENSLNQLAKPIFQMIQSLYTEQKFIRLVQPNNTERSHKLNQPLYDDFGLEIGKLNDITVGTYDIVVISGSTLPSNRWARFDYYMQLYQAQIIDQTEVLKQTEVADMEGVLERSSVISRLQEQLQQAMEEIKRLSGDLQTADREVVHANKRVEVEKFKSDIKGVGARVNAAKEVFTKRLEDELAMQKREAQMQRSADASGE